MSEVVRRELALLLVEVEGSLRALGRWESVPPAPERLASTVPFCHDTLEFTQWLQWVFVPRFRALLDGRLPLPGACGVAPLAEQAFIDIDADTDALLDLLRRVDALVSGSARA